MLDLAAVEIASARLHLRPTSEVYAQVIFEEFTSAITTFMFPPPASTIEETLAFLRGARAGIAAGTELEVVVLRKPEDEFIGHGGLHHVDSTTPELGIWIKESAHGQGYGREAVTALCDWAVTHLDFDYLKYPVDRRNLPSRRIPELLGGVVEAKYQMMNASGNRLDLLEYRIHHEQLRRRRDTA
jgi:RimJ/RimL family protein N-acetyltransferase